MKKLINLAMVALFGLFLFACSNSTGDKSEDEKTEEITTENGGDKENVNDETTNVLVVGEFENGDVFNGLKVKDLELANGGYFGFALEGEFVVTGEIIIGEMWEEYAIMIDDEYNPHKDLMIDIGKLEKQLISFCYFVNHEAFVEALDSEDLYSLQEGYTISISVRVEVRSVYGRLDRYGDSELYFIELVYE